MRQTKRTGKQLLVILLTGMIAMTTGGCAYVDNKSWDDMTAEEQEEVRQAFAEERKDLEEDFSDDNTEDRFALYILDRVEQAFAEDS